MAKQLYICAEIICLYNHTYIDGNDVMTTRENIVSMVHNIIIPALNFNAYLQTLVNTSLTRQGS